MGDWGWWENDLFSETIISNPRIWLYTDNLRRISSLKWVKIREFIYKILVFELEKDAVPTSRSEENNKTSHKDQMHIEKDTEVEGLRKNSLPRDLIVTRYDNPLIVMPLGCLETKSQLSYLPLVCHTVCHTTCHTEFIRHDNASDCHTFPLVP